jgi:hypothetical protein
MKKKLSKSESLRYNFKFGDIIQFKRRKYRFINLQGEDYFLWDIEKKDSIHIREYYISKFKKLGEDISPTPIYRWSF